MKLSNIFISILVLAWFFYDSHWVNRYQITTTSSKTFVIDSKTGEVWMLGKGYDDDTICFKSVAYGEWYSKSENIKLYIQNDYDSYTPEENKINKNVGLREWLRRLLNQSWKSR